ncbi:MAG: sugar ABC transporter permease [Firmicutes bacterium]|nr:sugar ABC transporter permease [Bacillota bacterium]
MKVKRGPLYWRQASAGLLFVTPAVILITVFVLGPLVFSFYISFFRWNMLQPLSRAKFVGIGNYVRVLTDETFKAAMWNTMRFSVGMVVLTLAVALLLALALNSKIYLRGLFRTIYFTPVVTSMVAVAIVWSYLYHPTYGLFNDILGRLGIKQMGFLTSTAQSLWSVMLVNVWKRAGYYMVIFLAGLQTVPAQLYEAARVDGANSWQMFRKITVPMLRPTVLLCVVVATIEALQVFTPVFVMTKGGPADSSLVAVLHMYDTAFSYMQMGRAASMTFILFVLIFIVTMIQVRLMQKGGVEAY